MTAGYRLKGRSMKARGTGKKGDDNDRALERLRRNKGAKCDGRNEKAALTLLRELGLDAG